MAEVTTRSYNAVSTYDTPCKRSMGVYCEESEIRDTSVPKQDTNATKTSASLQKDCEMSNEEGQLRKKPQEINSSESDIDDKQSISSDNNPNRLSCALSELSDLFQPEVEILVTPVDETTPSAFSDALPASRPTSLHAELDASGISNSLAASLRSISELSDVVKETRNENNNKLYNLKHGSLDRVADHTCLLRERTNARHADDYQSKRHSDGLAYSFFTPLSPSTPTGQVSPMSSNGSLSYSNRGVIGYSTCLSQETLPPPPKTCDDRRLQEMQSKPKTDNEMIDELLKDLMSAGEESTHPKHGRDQHSLTNGFDQGIGHRTCEFSRKTPRTHFVPRSRSEEFVRRSDSVSSCTMCGYTDRLTQLTKTSIHHYDGHDGKTDCRHRTPPIPTDDVESAVACLSDTIASGCDSQTLEEVVIATMRHNISRQTNCCHDDSPERMLDDVLETMETETYSGDVTLRRVFAVNEEYRNVKSQWTPEVGSYRKAYKSRMLHGSIKTDWRGEPVEGEYYTSTTFCRNMNRGTSPETMLDRALETITDIDDNFASNNVDNNIAARDTNYNFEQITSRLQNGNFGDNRYAPTTSSCECVADDKSTRSLDTDVEKSSTRDVTSEESDCEDRMAVVDEENSDGAFHKLIGETLQMTERILSSFSHISCERLDEDRYNEAESITKPDDKLPDKETFDANLCSVNINNTRNVHKSDDIISQQYDIVCTEPNVTRDERNNTNEKVHTVERHVERKNSADSFLDRLTAHGYDSGSDLNSELCTLTDDEPDLDLLVQRNAVVTQPPGDYSSNHKRLTVDLTSTIMPSESSDSKHRMEVARSPSPVEIVKTPPCIVINSKKPEKSIPQITSENVYQFPVKKEELGGKAEESNVTLDINENNHSTENDITELSSQKTVLETAKKFDQIAESLGDIWRKKTPPVTVKEEEGHNNRVVQIVDDESHKSVRYLFNSSTSKESKQHFEQLCSDDESMVIPYNSNTQVKSEEVDVQKVTMLFSWPKSPGPPGIPKKPTPEPKPDKEKPFKTYRFRRVIRIRADGVKEVIRGPITDAIEYDLSKNETEKSARNTNTKTDDTSECAAKDVKINLKFRRTKMKKKVNTGNKAIEQSPETKTKYRPTPPPKPNVKKALVEQSVKKDAAEPTAKEAFSEPIDEIASSQPIVKEALWDPVVKEALSDPVVKEASSDAIAKETSSQPFVNEASLESTVKKRGPKTLPKPDMKNWSATFAHTSTNGVMTASIDSQELNVPGGTCDVVNAPHVRQGETQHRNEEHVENQDKSVNDTSDQAPLEQNETYQSVELTANRQSDGDNVYKVAFSDKGTLHSQAESETGTENSSATGVTLTVLNTDVELPEQGKIESAMDSSRETVV